MVGGGLYLVNIATSGQCHDQGGWAGASGEDNERLR